MQDGTVISDPKGISEFNRAKFHARIAREDKIFMEILRDAKRDEFKGDPEGLRKHICARFDIPKWYYFSICKSKTMAISPSNRAQLETMLMSHIGQVLTDHQNIRAVSLENAWKSETSSKTKHLCETTLTRGRYQNGEPFVNSVERYVPRAEAAYKWFHRTISDHKMLYDTLKPWITKEFIARLDNDQIEDVTEMTKKLESIQIELNKRTSIETDKNKEAV